MSLPHTHGTLVRQILTTFEQDDYIFGALRAGASGFLLKGTRPEALILGQPFDFGHDLPNAGRRRGDVPLPCYLNHRYSSTEPFPQVSWYIVRLANQSQAEQFDRLYGRLWRVLLKADTDDLSQHERQLLHHVPAEKGIPLGVVARHLGMPKSSASEQVKSLERRGFLTRHRDPEDERQLSIVLTDAGVARVRQDSVLDLVRLAAALKKVSAEDRRALLTGLERLAAAADR
jgi:DNA-binding MarR family transcriptional regulator